MADIAKIDTFIQSSPLPAWLATAQGHCVYANPALERLTGFNSDQVNQADWRSFLLEEDRAVASASWQRSLATGTSYRLQVRMRGSDDIPKWVELIAFGHKAGDNPELWLFSALDVSRVVVEGRPELEAQLQATLNVIPAYTWYARPSGALTFVNKRHADYLGLPEDHALRFGVDVGAEWDSHLPLLHPDDHAEMRRAWSHSLRTGCAGEVSFRARNAEGGYRWFLSRVEPLRASDGTLLYWIGVTLDIDDAKRAEDALRKSEKELRDVIDSIPALVWSALPDGSNTYVNKRFVEYTGSSAEQVAGSGWKALIHPDDLERHTGKWGEAVATGEPHENEVRSRRSDGQYRWQLDRGVPLRDEEGNIVKWYGVTTDIEDRKHAEEALESMSRDLQESKTKLEEAQCIAHVGHFVWDLGNDGLTCSDEMYRIYGLRPQERLTSVKAFQEMVHPEDREFLLRAIEETRGVGHPDVEFRIVRPSGEVRIVHSQGAVTKDAPGQLRQRFGTVQDITDRKRSEEALQQSQFYLSEGQRLAHMGSWAFNATGFTYWSSELFRIYGLEPSGNPPTVEQYLALVHPEDRAFMKQGIAKMLEDHLAFDFTKRIVRPDGEIRHVRCVGVPVTQLGTFQGFLGTGMDVTEQERLTEELRRNEYYLSEGQRLAQMGSWAFNPSGFFEYWSQELYKIYGLDPLKGAPTLEQHLATVHPQDRDFIADTIKRMHAERSGCDVKKRIVRADGEQRYVRWVGIPVVEGEALKGFIGTAIDITEQELLTQELERQRAHLIEAQKLTHTGSWAWRFADRKIGLRLSEEWYRIYGLDPAEGSPTWEEYLERIHPEDRLKWIGITERAIAEKADYGQEFRILLPDGKVKWIRAVGQPVLSNTGDLEGFVGSSTDITELKAAEQEREKLRQLEADLAHINRVSTLGEMAASLAHEIKQPIAAAITSANSCIEWLSHEPPNLDRARAAAARIDKYGNRAAEIIDRIRSFYKKSPSQRELVDVNGIIHEMLTLLEGEACRLSVAMRTDLSDEVPKIVADRVQLQQVFMNLMLNGIEAMENSGGELTVKSKLQDGQLQFSVSDTGVGLPAEKMDQIFSAFYTTKPQGSGMGLAISRSIVESHGGRLWAAANDGRGATFYFTLPTEITELPPLVFSSGLMPAI